MEGPDGAALEGADDVSVHEASRVRCAVDVRIVVRQFASVGFKAVNARSP